MTLQFILVTLGGFGLFVCYAIWRLKRANSEIARLSKIQQQLQQEKAIANMQVKHFETRKDNEKNARNTDRTSLINELQKSGDLRD